MHRARLREPSLACFKSWNLHRPSDPTTDFAGLDFFISSVADHLTVWLGPRRLQPMILSAASVAEKLGVKCRGAMTHAVHVTWGRR